MIIDLIFLFFKFTYGLKKKIQITAGYLTVFSPPPNRFDYLQYIYREWERVQRNQKSYMETHHHHLFFYLVALAYIFACIEGLNRSDFPAGFVFGAGSSAYQVCMQQ